jgi:hypothetical protein
VKSKISSLKIRTKKVYSINKQINFSQEDINLLKINIGKFNIDDFYVLFNKKYYKKKIFKEIEKIKSSINIENISNEIITYIQKNISNKTLQQLIIKTCIPKDNICEICYNYYCNNNYINLIEKQIINDCNNLTLDEIREKYKLHYKHIYIFCRKNKIFPKTINNIIIEFWDDEKLKKLKNICEDNTIDDLSIYFKVTKIFMKKTLNIFKLKFKYKKYNLNIKNEYCDYILTNKNNTILSICQKLNINCVSLMSFLLHKEIYKPLCTKNSSILEYVIEKFLIENNIKFERQYHIFNDGRNLFIDFIVNNKAIEIYGDYWHGYDIPNKKNDLRDKNKIRQNDKIRELIIKSNFDDLLIIWEHDLLNNLEKTFKNILFFVK